MKKLKKAEWVIIALTFVCLVFTAGFLVGRTTSKSIVTIEKLSDDSTPVVADNTDADADTSSGLTDSTDAGAAASPAIMDYADTGASSGSAAENNTDVDNLAAVTDEPSAGSPVAAGQADEAAGKININTASASLLDSLPGIGEVLAGRIIDYREVTGGFKTIEEIMEVSGIGDKKFSDIKDLITV